MSAGRGSGWTDVREAMRRAARGLPEGLDGAHMFLEDRLEARVSISPRGVFEQASIRTTGVTAIGKRSVHVSDPPLSDLLSLASTAGSAAPHARAATEDTVSRTIPPPDLPVHEWSLLVRDLAGEGVVVRVVGTHQNVWVVTRDGRLQEDSRRSARLEVRSLQDSGAVMEVVLNGLEAVSREIVDRVRMRAQARRTAASIDLARGVGPLIFAPGVAGVVAHELVGHALEGDVALRGSRLASIGRTGGPVSLRVADDPRRGRGAWQIDDEGSTSREVTLLEGGQIAGRLHDRASASAVSMEVTGHGRRGSHLDTVLPRMGCTFIESGPDDPTEILRDTDLGLFIRRLESGHANPWSGRGTFIVTDADRIERGELTYPLLPFVIELDVVDAITSIDRIGDDLMFDTCIGSCVRAGQPMVTSVGAPTVRIGVVTAIV